MDYLNAQQVRWAMGAGNDAAVKAVITVLPEEAWRPLKTKDGTITGREVAETVHSTNRGQTAFRLISLRWREFQGDLFADTYYAYGLAINRLDETLEAVVWRDNKHAHIEYHIKELKKGGVGWSGYPAGT